MSAFTTWWHREGSAIRPQPDEDVEQFARRITAIAWSNGQDTEREACALLAEDLPAPEACNTIERHLWDVATVAVGDAIRERGKP